LTVPGEILPLLFTQAVTIVVAGLFLSTESALVNIDGKEAKRRGGKRCLLKKSGTEQGYPEVGLKVSN
jgi:hypothetical protein